MIVNLQVKNCLQQMLRGLMLTLVIISQAQSSDILRLPSGKPDLNGVWARPYVPDMEAAGNGRNQIGPGKLPFTEAGRKNFANYNPSEGDYTGSCLPFGLLRSMNSPDPIQFMQTDKYFALLYEQNTWFKVINLDGKDHSTGIPIWFGHSIAKWEGRIKIPAYDD